MLTGWKEREIAIKALKAFEENGKLRENLERLTGGLSLQDRAFIRELVSGTVRYLKLLDFSVERATGKSLKKQSSTVRNALRLIAYQLFFTGVPPYAAVNETVEAVKRLEGKKKGGFVNAVSKKLIGFNYKEEVKKIEDYYERISTLYSFPTWMVKRWSSFYGREETEELLKSLNQVAPLFLRVNTLRTDLKEFTKLLRKEGIEFELHPFIPHMVRVKGRVSVKELPGYSEGLFYVQDPASYLAALLLNPKPGEVILDVGAAPGGKTTAIAALTTNMAKVVAVDVSKERGELLKENAERLGVKNLEVVITDIREDKNFIKKFYKSFDKILIDAPCSATGVIRRHPEGKWNKSMSLIKHNQEIQKGLLKASRELLKDGGTLLYSVCSLEREEGEKNVLFAAKELKYKPSKIEDFKRELKPKQNTLRVFPHKNKLDGFFYGKFKM
ncbi:16S rRNA (cytosine(967)-C(5))-methyltransferase RsmB [Thermovibrio sp.]